MSQQLISLSRDLKKLMDQGLEVQISSGYLLVDHVPYVTSAGEVKYGALVSELTLAGNKTAKPKTHVIHFIGEHPCNKDGSMLTEIKHTSGAKRLGESLTVDHSFSNKPRNGYEDYYEKVTRYIEIISAPAKSLDPAATEITFKIIGSNDEESVFTYYDTNSSRADINALSDKLKHQKVAIIGLGGTGSYILDLVAKTPVSEIHLFDGDLFLQHNAFRAPGAPSLAELRQKPKKTDYLTGIYSEMHKGIVSHPYNITTENVKEILEFDFVFLSVDSGEAKMIIITALEESAGSFIDVGMGIHVVDDSLIGIIRTSTSTSTKREHIHDKHRISFGQDQENEYSENIQIAELNALNASLAVIKWKKLCGFYQDLEREHFTSYTLNTNQLLSEDLSL